MIKKIWRIFCFLVLILAVFIAFGTLWLRRTWGNISIESLILTITRPVVGADPEIVFSGILAIGVPIIAAIAGWFIVFAVSKRYQKLNRIVDIGVSVIPAVLLVAAVLYADDRYDVFHFVSVSRHPTDIYINGTYVPPENVKIEGTDTNNLLLIFLESVENSFFPEELGGANDKNPMPELGSLLEENVSFSNTDRFGGPLDFYGTGWSIASYVANMSGLPLSPSAGNNLVNVEFMPGAVFLFDILSDSYIQEVVCGQKSEFAGLDNLLYTHGNVDIFDLYKILDEYRPDKNAKRGWGVLDYFTFMVAKDRITKVYNQAVAEHKKFSITMMTIDLHTPNGYECKNCPQIYSESYQNIIACQSKQVDSFIRWCKEQPWYEETTIVLVGDHPTMANMHVGFIPDNYVRTTYNCIINSKVTPVCTQNRQFTRCDMFPTILAAMGYTIEGERLALGTNLFSDKPTLIEEFGAGYIENEVAGLDVDFSRKIYGGIMF